MADAAPLWVIAAGLGAYIGVCVASGRTPGRGRSAMLDRRRSPAAFWAVMALLGATLAAVVILAMQASLRG